MERGISYIGKGTFIPIYGPMCLSILGAVLVHLSVFGAKVRDTKGDKWQLDLGNAIARNKK